MLACTCLHFVEHVRLLRSSPVMLIDQLAAPYFERKFEISEDSLICVVGDHTVLPHSIRMR